MILPEWLKSQDNAFLMVAVLLLLWLWLLVHRRQEEEEKIPQRPITLRVEDLGRKSFIAIRSNDVYLYRGLFINGAEANSLLGDMAKEYLEKRSVQLLKNSMQTLSAEIPNNSTYVGLSTTEGTKLIIKIKAGKEEKDIYIGSVTRIDNSWRLLEPVGGLVNPSS